MINITVSKNARGINKVIIKGHAGYAPHGHDIVCAAVSALSINCVNSIYELTGDGKHIEIKAESGDFEMSLNRTKYHYSLFTDVLLDSLMVGLNDLVKQYGEYINLKEE